MTEPPPASVAVVGHGLIGGALGERLGAVGLRVLKVSKRPATGCVPIDLTSVDGRIRLAELVREWRPGAVVLVHGPMDIDWCQTHEAEAVAAHAGTVDAIAGSDVPIVLVSSDAVFAGDEPAYADDVPPAPGSAYGRAKLAAESRLAGNSRAAIVRLSYVYGRLRRPADRDPRFDVACLMDLTAGRTFDAPVDQFFTPVSIHDVIRVLEAVILGRVAGTFHLAGPRRLSRYEFAVEMARGVGAPHRNVVGVPRSATRWASRPRNSCLVSSDLARVLGWPSFEPADPEQGIARFVADAGASRRTVETRRVRS